MAKLINTKTNSLLTESILSQSYALHNDGMKLKYIAKLYLLKAYIFDINNFIISFLNC